MREIREEISCRRQLVLSLEVLTILAGLPPALVAAYAFWMSKLQRDVKVGKRVRLKWKDLSLQTKLYGVALSGYLISVVYSDVSTIIPIMAGTGSSFLALLQGVVVSLWLAAVGLLGVGLLHSLRSPVRKTTI